MGAVGGDQAGELAAAGHHHQAAGRAGQQRADLLGAARVVQDDQHPPTVHKGPVQAHLVVQVERDPYAGNAQGAKEPGQRVDRRRCPAGMVAAQVEPQLPVRESVCHPPCPVHGEGGLAHAGGTGHDRALLPGVAAEQGVEVGQLRGPAGEPGHVGW